MAGSTLLTPEKSAADSDRPRGHVEDKHDGTVTFGNPKDIWVALLATVISGVIFHMTAARGTTFWDCGEFIACSYILGVPHPPGAALFVMLGRVISILPFGETAFQLALFSAYSSALAVGFCALTLPRVIRRITGFEQNLEDYAFVYGGAIAGSLAMAFGATYWFNAVEAEVYGLTLLLVSLLLWLSMLWLERARTPEGNRILLIQTFILFIGATNHMQAFLPIVPMFFLFFLIDPGRRKNPLFYIVFFLLTSVIYSIDVFVWGLPIFAAILIAGAFLTTDTGLRQTLLFASKFLIVAMLGYSLYAYIPIRSSLNPAIDENNPETWANFKMFLERKQYSDKSMFELMFTRKGTWTNQFGTFQRIGFWGHLRDQWVPTERLTGHYLIVPAITIFALWAMWKRDRKIFFYFLGTLLLFTLAMTLYLNFSDGTKGVKMEVRNRDYFYTPGFVIITWLFGIGTGALLRFVRGSSPAFAIAGRVLLVLALLIAPRAVKANYFETDRSRFWVAEDLAHNMLVGLRENAIIFTGGDNDTFPLWYAQEVRDFRKDVQVINLSLLNTPWYIMQLKHQGGVNISLKDDEIANLRGYYTPGGEVVTVKDIMMPIIIRENVETRPVYYAVTVPQSDREIVGDHLLQEGLVVRVELEIDKESFDISQMEQNFAGGRYRFRGLTDPTIYKDSDTIRLLTNYNACLYNLAQLFLRRGEPEQAQTYVDMLKSFPHDNSAGYRMLVSISELMEDWDAAAAYSLDAVRVEPQNPDNYLRRSEYLRRAGRSDEAIAFLTEMKERFPGEDRFNQGIRAIQGAVQSNQPQGNPGGTADEAGQQEGASSP